MLVMSNGKYISRDLTLTTDADSDGFIEAANDVAQADISDLTNVSLVLNQITDGGTATLVVDYSLDGTNWVTGVATKADTDFAAGANQAEETYTLSDSNGMAKLAKLIRVRCTAATAGGQYTATVSGVQRQSYR